MSARRLHPTAQTSSHRTLEVAQLRELMGPSEASSRVCRDVARVASSGFTVLIVGETGSGKEVVARAIHQFSPRAYAPFVAVDCGAIPETLFESELFGHERGSFTGADRSAPGKFEVAKDGTLFLDEISNMQLGSQAKLLRALQERSICRIGSVKPIEVQARVLVATSSDLEAAVARGMFRSDLVFRLNEFVIRVPPLRERKEDIPSLVTRFIDLTNDELGKAVQGCSPEALERLLAFRWPGNVRQLRTTIRRAVLLADILIELEHLDVPDESDPPTQGALAPVPDDGVPLKELVRRAQASVERAAVISAIKRAKGNKTLAARLLQIDCKTLYAKLKKYELQPAKTVDDLGTKA